MKITVRSLAAPCLILILACFVGIRMLSYNTTTTSKIEISSGIRNVHSISIGSNDSNIIDNVQYSKSSLALKRLAQFHEVSSANITNTKNRTSLQSDKSKSYHDYAQSWWRRNETHTEQNNTSSVKNIVDQFHELSSVNNSSTLKSDSNNKNNKRKQNKPYHYHDYAIFLVHYHKTGYVLSRELKHQVISTLEVAANLELPKVKKVQKNALSNYSNLAQFEVSGINEETGERVTFDQLGNWIQSAFPQRQHLGTTNCPAGPLSKRGKGKPIHTTRGTKFQLQSSTIHIQESPDLFCSVDDLLDAMSLAKAGTKIIHLIRNPFEMTMSNFFYHSQTPTPEKWVHTDDPCQHLYPNNKSLSSNVIPALTSWARNRTDIPKVTQTDLDNIVDVCLSLWRKRDDLRNATFYEHLLKLDKTDALRLATAQMTVASGAANKHYAGGDILRMANNIIRFQNIQASSSNVQVMSLGMGDFITDTKEATLKFLNFIFGDDEKITHEMRLQAATDRAKAYEKQSKHSHHITSSNSKVAESKEVLRQMLKSDNLTEVLVNEALSMSVRTQQ